MFVVLAMKNRRAQVLFKDVSGFCAVTCAKNTAGLDLKKLSAYRICAPSCTSIARMQRCFVPMLTTFCSAILMGGVGNIDYVWPEMSS